MRTGRLFATLAVAALVACAGRRHALPGGERCPAHGGAPWREYRTRHFVVDTDLDPSAAAALADDLERLRALVAAALVPDPPEIPGYVRVVVPASVHTYHALAPKMAAGYFGVTALGEPVVVLQPEVLARDPEVIAHELAHHFTWWFFPRQPRWFAEGIAQFVQTVAEKGPDGARAGRIPKQRAAFLGRGAAMPAGEILEGRRDDAELELWSWVLYHWLWSHRSGELSEYERRLGRAEDPRAAWRASFPEFAGPQGLDELTRALDAHRRAGAFASYPVRARWDGAFTVAPLEAADVHMLLLGASVGRSAEALRKEVDAALDDDPGNPVAVWRKARLDGTSSAPALRAVAAARPGDWRAWLLLAESLRDDAKRGGAEDAGRGRIEAYRRALALNPSAARAHADLALALAEGGELREALAHARRAAELWPADARTLTILASVAAGLGACDEAAPVAARARDLLPQDAAADEARRELAEIERRCGAHRSP